MTNYSVTGSGAFTDKNAGIDKGHTVGPSTNTVALNPAEGNVTYFGLQFFGYTRPPGPHVSGEAGNPISQITPRPITAIGLDGIDRVYNGGTAVGVNASGASLAGTIGGDAVSLVASGATGTLADKNVGTDKPVTVGGLSLAGADAGNYTVTAAAGATATITPLGITSTGFTGVDRVYDGTTVVAVNASAATLTGVLGSDSVAVTGGTGSVANKNVGTAKPVTRRRHHAERHRRRQLQRHRHRRRVRHDHAARHHLDRRHRRRPHLRRHDRGRRQHQRRDPQRHDRRRQRRRW